MTPSSPFNHTLLEEVYKGHASLLWSLQHPEKKHHISSSLVKLWHPVITLQANSKL
jgi:hypothetical protein